MKKATITTCYNCHKPLSDPISVARGIGPDCWAQRMVDSRKDKSNLFGGSNYSWGIDGNILWLKDNGGPGRSLTNDMENALAEIQGQIENPLTEYRIIYKDSDGAWDGVTIKRFNMKAVLADYQWLQSGKSHYFANGLDVDFYYIGAKTYEQAKQNIHN